MTPGEALFYDFQGSAGEFRKARWENQTQHIKSLFEKFAREGLNHPSGRCWRVRPDGTVYSFWMMVSPEKYGLHEYRISPKFPRPMNRGRWEVRKNKNGDFVLQEKDGYVP